MNELQNAVIDTIKILTEENNKNLKFDYTKRGKIVSISPDKKKCKVMIDGEENDCEVRNGLIANIGDEVLVNILMNNYSAKVVDGKIGTLGSIDEGTVTTHNHDDLYYTKIQIDERVASSYTHNQNTPSDKWIITHNLGKFPSVMVTDSAGSVIVGKIVYISSNEINVIFNSAFSGQSYLN
jgi:hypothetical protein